MVSPHGQWTQPLPCCPFVARGMMNFTPCRPSISCRLHFNTLQMHPIFLCSLVLETVSDLERCRFSQGEIVVFCVFWLLDIDWSMLVWERKEKKQQGNWDVVFEYVTQLLVMLLVRGRVLWQVRPWPSTQPGLTTPRPLSPQGIPVCGSHDPGQWPLSPPPLIIILLYTPILFMCTNFSPSVSTPSAFHSFLHLFLLLLSLSPPLCSAHPHV